MSSLIVGKFAGDTDKFRQALLERGDEFAAIAERAKQAGAIHHRFGIGDGFWASGASVQRSDRVAGPALTDRAVRAAAGRLHFEGMRPGGRRGDHAVASLAQVQGGSEGVGGGRARARVKAGAV